MDKRELFELWGEQKDVESLGESGEIIKKAGGQRRGQVLTISILTMTVLVLMVYAFYYARFEWNGFTYGLLLMIGSLTFRVALEILSLKRKESQLVSLSHRDFKAYLKKYHKYRLRINYYVTPICFVLYIIGFVLLIPFLREAFSEGFFNYLMVSGVVSLLLIAIIVIRSAIEESRFLSQLNKRE